MDGRRLMTVLDGRYLFGAVRYRIEGETAASGHCFCTDCRQASGTGHGTHVTMRGLDMDLSGDLRVFDTRADGGNVLSCGFGPECGVAVLSRNAAMPGIAFWRASSRDDPEQAAPAMTVFASGASAAAHVDRSHAVFPAELDVTAAMR